MKKILTCIIITLTCFSCTDEARKGLVDGFKICETLVIQVTEEVGNPDDVTTCADGEPCNLRNALHTASNALCGEENLEIILELPTETTYILSEGVPAEPSINSQTLFPGFNIKTTDLPTKAKIRINGNGSTFKLLDSPAEHVPDHLFFIHPNSIVSFYDINFETGPVHYSNQNNNGQILYNQAGGAIHNMGIIEVHGCTFYNCQATIGAAIFNGGSATITTSVFRENEGTFLANLGESYGAAIANESFNADLKVSNCEFIDNKADKSAAIFNGYDAKALFTDCKFKNNFSLQDIGPIFNQADGTMEILTCEFENNVPWGLHNEGILLSNGAKFFTSILQTGRTMNALKSNQRCDMYDTKIYGFECVLPECEPLIDLAGTAIFDDLIVSGNSNTTMLKMEGTGSIQIKKSAICLNKNVGRVLDLSCPTVFIEASCITQNEGSAVNIQNAFNVKLVNNTIYRNETNFNGGGAIDITGENTNLDMLHNSILDNPVASEFGEYEVLLKGTYSFIKMQNNYIIVQPQEGGENNNKHISMPDPFSSTHIITDNYLDTQNMLIKNQKIYSDAEIFEYVLLYDIEKEILLGHQVIPPSGLRDVAPKLDDVPTDQFGQERIGPLVDVGAIELF